MSEQQFSIVQQFASINSFALATLYLEDKYLMLDKEKVVGVYNDLSSLRSDIKQAKEEEIDIDFNSLTVISPMEKYEDIKKKGE